MAQKGFGNSPTLAQANATMWTFTGATTLESMSVFAVVILIGAGVMIVGVYVLLLRSEKIER